MYQPPTSSVSNTLLVVNMFTELYNLSVHQEQEQEQHCHQQQQQILLLKQQAFCCHDSNQTTMKKTKKGVRFFPFTTTVERPSSSVSLTMEEVKELLWIPQEELRSYKIEARKLIRNGTICRGLEGCTIERQKHRYLTRKYTVHAHRQGLGPDHTAMVSRRCSEWNEELAFVQACNDYCDVYNNDTHPTPLSSESKSSEPATVSSTSIIISDGSTTNDKNDQQEERILCSEMKKKRMLCYSSKSDEAEEGSSLSTGTNVRRVRRRIITASI